MPWSKSLLEVSQYQESRALGVWGLILVIYSGVVWQYTAADELAPPRDRSESWQQWGLYVLSVWVRAEWLMSIKVKSSKNATVQLWWKGRQRRKQCNASETSINASCLGHVEISRGRHPHVQCGHEWTLQQREKKLLRLKVNFRSGLHSNSHI